MTLERYNQILWAVLGTVAALGGVVLGVTLVIGITGKPNQPTIVLGKPNQPKQKQEILFCEPIAIRGANRQLFPVAVFNVDDSESGKGVVYQAQALYRESYSLSRCGLHEYGGSSRIFNVIVRDTQSGRQWLLLDRPAQLESLNMPSEKCKSGEGLVPCGVLQWHIRDRDTNKDGVIDNKDALVIFHSDLQIAGLMPVTPQDASLMSFVWDRDRNALLYQVRVDTNGNGEFEKNESTRILEYKIGKSNVAESVVDEGMRKELLSRIGR